ncbi:MAG: hypothetical protein M0R74_10310 [Dehalococcoidia bacterium]|nr:hypothetical protein [Dehalococcoidia bacterium]
MRQRTLWAGIVFAMATLIAVPAAIVLGDEEPGEAPSFAEAAIGTAISYQGRLTDGGAPANGSYDVRFTLYNEAVGGDQQGVIITKENLQVENGLFTTQLEFGADAFDGQGRWIEIAVRAGSEEGDDGYIVLSPRQPITAAPYAFWANTAGALNLPFAATGTSPAAAGVLDITSAGDGAAIAGRRNETEGVGDAIVGNNAGAGGGVRGISTANGGTGVRGDATGEGGIAGQFMGETALDINGAIRVWGPVRPAFRITVETGTNTCAWGGGAVIIDHSMANGDPNALLFVTALTTGGATGDVVVGYNIGSGCPVDKWVIGGVLDGQQYNVLVIKDAVAP